MQSLLENYISKAQRQYLNYIQDQIADLRSKPAGEEPHEDIAGPFLIMLMEMSITPLDKVCCQTFVRKMTSQGKLQSSFFMRDCTNNPERYSFSDSEYFKDRSESKTPLIQAKRRLELDNFYKVFLRSKPLYISVQRALQELKKSEASSTASIDPIPMSPVLGKR